LYHVSRQVAVDEKRERDGCRTKSRGSHCEREISHRSNGREWADTAKLRRRRAVLNGQLAAAVAAPHTPGATTTELQSRRDMPPFTKTEFIWMNGELLTWDAAQLHVTAHALQYATGVFEGMR